MRSEFLDMSEEIELRAIERMKNICRGDREMAHCAADSILCDVLRQLGCGNLVDVYSEIPKWYA